MTFMKHANIQAWQHIQIKKIIVCMTRLHKNNHDSWTNMFNLKLISTKKFYNFPKGSRFKFYDIVNKCSSLKFKPY